MCFGMGILLTEEEWEIAAPITRSCFAALGLVNDYFSFDVEWEEYIKEKKDQSNAAMTNLVWLYMQWENLSIPEAKERTRETVRRFEADYYEKVNAFTTDSEKFSPNLAKYLKAQAYQISGNVAWSLRCPRYHPELCDKAEKILHSQPQDHQDAHKQSAGSIEAVDSSESSGSAISGASSDASPRSSVSSNSSIRSEDDFIDLSKFEDRANLSDEVRYSLFSYPWKWSWLI